jgi:hypothetical protein
MRVAHSIQAASAFNVHLSPDEDSRLMFQHLVLTMQQKPNARIKLPDINIERHPSDHDNDASPGQLE